ncbi:unnamed protein product [Auanema sp. JU1783]|nr:unnamed protein product [Auanema sp. JU1783]
MVAASPRLDVNNPFLRKIISEQRLKTWEFEEEQQREIIEKSLKDISRSAIACKRYTRNVIEDHSRLLTEIENVHKELNKLAEFDKQTHKLSDADKATWLTAATIMKASHSFAESHKEQRDTFVTSIVEMQRLVLKILNFGVKHFTCSRLIVDKSKCSFRDDHNCKLEQKKCRKTCLCSDCESPLPDISPYLGNRTGRDIPCANPCTNEEDSTATVSSELKEIKQRVYEQSQITRGILTDLQVSQNANEMLQAKVVRRAIDDISSYPNEDLENDKQACNQRKRRKTSFSEDSNDFANTSKREKVLPLVDRNQKFANCSLPENQVTSKECSSISSSDCNKLSSTSSNLNSNSYAYIKLEPVDECDGTLKPELDSERGSIDMEIDSESQNTTCDEAIGDIKDEIPCVPSSCPEEFIRKQLNAPSIAKEETLYPTSSYQISHYDKMISSPKVTLNITPLSGDENEPGSKREKSGCPSSITKSKAPEQSVSNIIGKRLVCSQTVPEANVESVLHAALKRPLATPKSEPPKVVTPTLPGVSSTPFMGSSMIPPPFPNPHMFMYMPGPPPPFPFPPWPYPMPPPKNGPEAYHVPPPPMMPQWMSNFYGHIPPFNSFSLPARPHSRRHPEHEPADPETNNRKH